MYSYPEALDAMQKIATDLFAQAKAKKIIPADKLVTVRVVADSQTGTASVTWEDHSYSLSVLIYMPVLPATYKMTAKEFDAWAAYLYHEVGHPLFTSKAVWETAVRAGKHRLLNSLEDVREENCSNRSGIAANGKQVLTDLIESLHAKAESEGFDPNEPKHIGWVMSYLGRAACNGYPLDTSFITGKLNPNGPVAKVLTWAIPELGACRSTQDCFELSERIIAALPKNAPQEPEQGEQGESEQEGTPEPKEGTPDAKEGEQGEQPKPEGETSKGGKGGKGGTDEPLTDADIEETSLAPKPSEALSAGYKADAEASVIQAIREAGEKTNRKPKPVADGYASDATSLTQAAAKAARQRSLLARALKANEQDSFEGNRRTGRIDRKAFGRMAAGSQAIFGKRTVQEGYETDVAILVDGSGSMAGYEIGVAMELALVVSQAAAQVGVNCDAFLFNGSNSLHEITTGKRKPNALKFSGAKRLVNGGTPLCTSLLKVAFKQVARAQGKRKLLFAVTDGGCNMGFTSMVATVAYIEKSLRIEVVNLMIGQPVSGAFTNEVSVPYNKSVCEVGLEQLVRQLERAA